MRTLRVFLAGTVMLALLGGLVGTVVAQSEDGRTADWATFTDQDCSVGDHDPPTTVNGVEQLRDLPITCDITFSDPRLSGTQSTIYNEDCFERDICVYWGSHESVGPDGTWSGWFHGTVDSDGNARGYDVLTGAGGYEGLTVVRHAMGPLNEPPSAAVVIYEGDPLPLP